MAKIKETIPKIAKILLGGFPPDPPQNGKNPSAKVHIASIIVKEDYGPHSENVS